jgi:hypothetical protein
MSDSRTAKFLFQILTHFTTDAARPGPHEQCRVSGESTDAKQRETTPLVIAPRVPPHIRGHTARVLPPSSMPCYRGIGALL